ncbi:MAG TPA: long-chain-fatty-acid--CoA ligase [Trebonia sp.]|jgi:acyl-CoA synthetase (AMP-forming)/AMP-acid ligase II|nr:long-chain-fatty-acid--CoA ligase [Trebonia sp.]
MRLTHGLHRGLQQYPDALATIDGERVRTWRESENRVARLAAGLRMLGLSSGERVAILALNSDAYHECQLAAAWAGAVFVPVNTRWSMPEVAFTLRDSGARVLLVDDYFVPLVEDLRAEGACPETVLYAGPEPVPAGLLAVEGLIAENRPMQDAERGGAELAAIYYTGGTTGRAKGVMLSHASMISSALTSFASGAYVAPGARYLHAAPMFHSADASGWVAVNALGGTHVFLPRFTPGGAAEAIQRYRVTDTIMVPTMIRLLIDSPEAAGADLSSLQRLIYGGSPIDGTVLARARERLHGTAFTQAYAMTEMSPVMTLLTPADHHVSRLRDSAGRAVPHVDIRIADDYGSAPAGTIGEILARGGGQMLGYWNRPDETKAALDGGWMRTGDSGYLSGDGYLFVVDRIKDMIISGGENVYSAEVENALASHSAVAASAVIGVGDQVWGEHVHAVVVLADGASISAEELRAYVKTRIAAYKAPRTIQFAESLPLSGAGKVLKQQLRDEYRAKQEL